MKNGNWDEETQELLQYLMDELLDLFPNLKPHEDLFWTRLYQNIPEGIKWEELNQKNRNKLHHTGEFKAYERITIDPRAPFKEEVCFHEFIHAITFPAPGQKPTQLPSFLEVLTTLVEEYRLYCKNGSWPEERINGYLDDFGKQLLSIIGLPLLEQYLVDEKHLYQVLPTPNILNQPFICEQYQKQTLKQISTSMSKIMSLVNMKASDQSLIFYVRQLEEMLVVILLHKLENEKGDRFLIPLQELLSLQDYPSYQTYYNALKEAIKKEQITLNEYLDFPYAKVWDLIEYIRLPEEETELSSDNKDQLLHLLGRHMNDKDLSLATEQLFGLSDYLSDQNFEITIQSNPYIEISKIMDRYQERQQAILECKKQYEYLLESIIDGKQSLEELSSLEIHPEMTEEETHLYQRQLLLGKYKASRMARTFQDIMEQTTFSSFFLTYESKIVKFVSDDTFYEPISWQDFCDKILSGAGEFKNAIIQFLKEQIPEEIEENVFYATENIEGIMSPITWFTVDQKGNASKKELDFDNPDDLFLDEELAVFNEQGYPVIYDSLTEEKPKAR